MPLKCRLKLFRSTLSFYAPAVSEIQQIAKQATTMANTAAMKTFGKFRSGLSTFKISSNAFSREVSLVSHSSFQLIVGLDHGE